MSASIKLAVTALGLAFAGQAMAAALTVISFGGAGKSAQDKAYYRPFQRATGIKVIGAEYNGEMAKIKAMVDSRSVSWDVVEVEPAALARGCDEGLFEKLDYSKIGKPADFLAGAVQSCGIGMNVWSIVLAYNADKLKGTPAGWKDFWDVKAFPGKRGLRKGAQDNLEFALLADGVAPKDVYKVLATPTGVDRAFRKLDQLRPNIQWWEAGSQPPQFLVSGDVVMSSAYNGRISEARKEGKNLKAVWNGSVYNYDYWAIPKGSPRKDDALKFIRFATQPANQKVYADTIDYGVTHRKAIQMLDATRSRDLPTSPRNLAVALSEDTAFWVDRSEELEQRFNAWVAKSK